MTKEVGASAGLVALLGLFLHMQVPRVDTGAEQTGASAGAVSTSDKKSQGAAREPIEGPWLATEAFFHAATSSLAPLEDSPRFAALITQLTQAGGTPDPDTLSSLLGVPPDSGRDPAVRGKRFAMVATVADPSHTHLALFLDGQTEVIERSMLAAGWQFAEHWLPWDDYFDGHEPDINARREQRHLQRDQEEMPGILVFRGDDSTVHGSPRQPPNASSDPALFVFLVPETVTGGVSGPAFEASMHMAKALSPENPIGILAPSFSGSFASLAKLVRDWRGSLYGTVYSGSASNPEYAQSFRDKTGMQFYSGILDSNTYKRAVCDVLMKYGITRGTALLKEDEGGFQQSFGGPSKSSWRDSRGRACPMETFVFPRDISHLRNAYQESQGNIVQNPYSDQPARLSFTIRDQNRGEDSIPTFSETQTPLTQDAILNSITGAINRVHTQAVLISATNRLDALFLSRVLRAACPDTRIFIDGPDMLFVTAADREGLAGTIFVSSYPMSFEGDRWLDPDDAGRPVFAESTLQGLYNVSLLLLEKLHATTAVPSLHGYKQPGRPYPGIWLLTLNRSGFAPVDLMDEPDSAKWFAHAAGAGGPLPASVAWLPSRGWLFTVSGLSIAILLCCVIFVRSNIPPYSRPMWLRLSDNYAPKQGALLTAGFSMSAAMWLLAWPWWNAPVDPSIGWARTQTLRLLVLAGALVPLIILAAAISMSMKRGMGRPGERPAAWRDLFYSGVPLILFGFAVPDWEWLCGRPATGLFFRFRSLELYSGSSPAMPLALACLAFCSLAIAHLKRYGVAGALRARLTINPGQDHYRHGLRDAYREIERRIGSPWCLSGRAWIGHIAVGAAFVLLFFAILGVPALNAFELPQYNWLLLAAVALILMCVAMKSHDLLSLGAAIKKLLDLIQIHPQRRKMHAAIQRISRDWPKRTIWSFNRAVSRNTLEREMLYRLDWRSGLYASAEREGQLQVAAAAGMAGEGRTAVSQPRELPVCPGSPEEDARNFRELLFVARHSGVDRGRCIEKLQEHCAELAAHLYDCDLKWGNRADAGPQNPTEGDYASCCEDFVALQLCQFLVYLVSHVKRIAISLSLVFVLLMLLFTSYNPGGPRLIAHMLLLIFLLIGAFVWRVFSQMERDPVLSLIANTGEGKLSGEFWLQIAALGSLPLLGILGHLFPSATQFLFQWIAPSVQQLH